MSAVTERRQRLDQALAEQHADLFLSEAMPDIRYFTGCMDAGGFLLLSRKGEAVLIINAHDAPQAFTEAIDTRIIVWRPGENLVKMLQIELGSRTSDIIAPSLSATLFLTLRESGIEIKLKPGLSTQLRRIKEPAELDLMRRAARIVEAGMAAARDALIPGVREIEVAAEAEHVMRGLGMDGRIFETKVESGPRSAMPSTYAGERRIKAGDLVLIDIGPTYRGYFGDLTRTFAIGDPGPARRELLELVLVAQLAGIAAVRAGVTGHDVDDAARQPIRAAGFEDGILHNTGHSLGLAGDSLPLVAPGSFHPLLVGEGITIEPGAYRDDIGGVRIEDEVLVTQDGSELLTSFPKTLDSLILPV